MIVYIAGKISNEVNPQVLFNKVEKELTEKGNIVLNPLCIPKGLTQQSYMDICFAMIRASDAIFFLDNWKDSEGAVAEYHYAKKIGTLLLNI